MERADFYRLPFPNDIRRTADGRVDLGDHPFPGASGDSNLIEMYLRAAENLLDGFSTNPVVYFRFSAPPDPATVDDNVAILNIDPASPRYGEIHSGVKWYVPEQVVTRYICPPWIAIRTEHGAPLMPSTTYAAIVRRGILAEETGLAFERSPDFDLLLDEAAPTDPTLRQAWQAYAPLRQWLDQQPPEVEGDILSAAVFTTRSVESLARGLRSAVHEGEPPTMVDIVKCGVGVVSPCDDGTSLRSCWRRSGSSAYEEFHARIEVPIFQRGDPPYLSPEDGGDISLGLSGLPEAQRRESICVGINVPAGSPPPDAGWPLVVFLHGTGGSFRSPIYNGFASAFASMGVATMSFDLPQHGSRKNGSSMSPDLLFFNVNNPYALSGNILQGAADFFSVVLWAREADVNHGDNPDSTRIRFGPIAVFAHSQGSIHAGIAVPWEPDVGAAVFSGGGGDITLSLLSKVSPVNLPSILPIVLRDIRSGPTIAAREYHPMLALLQAIYDPADPVNYAARLHRAPWPDAGLHHVFVTSGLGDSYTPESTHRAYAVAAGMTLVEPILTRRPDGSPDTFGLPSEPPPVAGNVRAADGTRYTVALRQYRPPSGVDGHFVVQQLPTAREDVLRFLLAALQGQVPPVGE